MRRTPSTEALEALDALDERGSREVLGWLCASCPEAVLAAVAGIARHREVVRGLTQREPGPS